MFVYGFHSRGLGIDLTGGNIGGICMPDELTEEELTEEAKEFFLFFAKFEYAMKNSEFADTSNDRVKPNWDTFKSWVAGNLDPIGDNDSDIQELKVSPPKYQSPTGWQSAYAKITSNGQLIEACQIVRNNLFHGGKINDENRRRNLIVLRAVRKILTSAMSSNSDLQRAFDRAVF